MQRVVSYSAEDSCVVKYQLHNDGSPTIESRDVEKTGLISLDRQTTAQPVAGKDKPSLNENPSQSTRESDSDQLSLPIDDERDNFPEGGLKGWAVAAGAFCGFFSIFGIINSTAVLLDYFGTHQLKDYNSSQIGWIFGLALFLTFFCGAPIGPIFDAYGPRALIFAGSILLIASMFLLGLCTRKYLETLFRASY
jgi:hypothetical protein